MQMNLFRSLLILIFVGAIIGCAPSVPLQRAQVAVISREIPPAQLDSVLANATIQAQFEFKFNEVDYIARHYDLLVGTRQDMTMICSPVCIAIPISVPVTTQYVVIQSLPDKHIYAWGTLEELSKDSESDISSIMPVVKQHLAEAQQRKK